MKSFNKIALSLFLSAGLFFANPVLAFASTLALSPATGTFSPGCSFSVNVILDTAGVQTDGTDVILLYDNSKLNVSSITPSTLYPDYPIAQNDSQNGKVSISGLASVSQPVTASNATFASVNFTVSSQAAAGATTVKFDFDPNDPGKTTDSNVVQRGTVSDTLNGVTNGSFVVGTGTCGSSPVTIGSPLPGSSLGAPGVGGEVSSSSGEPIQTLPNGGSSSNTLALAGIGGILTILGIIGLSLL